jgi:hypothetical protein
MTAPATLPRDALGSVLCAPAPLTSAIGAARYPPQAGFHSVMPYLTWRFEIPEFLRLSGVFSCWCETDLRHVGCCNSPA